MILKIAAFLAAIASSCQWLSAQDCSVFESMKQAWDRSEEVFIGEVIPRPENVPPPYNTKPSFAVRVTHSYKGVSDGEIVFILGDAGPVGGRYVFSLAVDPLTHALYYLGCGGTAALDEAAVELSFLQSLPKSTRENRIAGTACSLPGSDATHTLCFSGLKVTLTSGNRALYAVTNSEGLYEFAGLADGAYCVSIEQPAGAEYSFYTIAGERDRKVNAKPPCFHLAGDSEIDIGLTVARSGHKEVRPDHGKM